MKVDELMLIVKRCCDAACEDGVNDILINKFPGAENRLADGLAKLRTALSACVAEWLPVDTEAVIDESKDYFVCWNLQCHFPEYATAWRRGELWICPSDQRVYLVTPTHYKVATPPTPPPTETEGETK